MIRIVVWATLLVLMTGLSVTVHATTFYVDFDSGNDANDGIAPAAPWEHAPGDPNAMGKAASKTLGPGDTVLFKGGVVYRGRIVLSRSGSSNGKVTYKGDGWGNGKAVMEGAEVCQPVWTTCPSAAACSGNPNYSKIHYAAAPFGYTSFLTALYENGELLWYSQGPNPTDPFYHDEIGDFYTVPYPNTSVIQNQSSITDPRVLIQASSTFWNGASVAGWITGNLVDIRPVTSFDPGTHTLYHEPFTNPPYKDREGRYALMNHVSLIDRAGEYAFDQSAGRIYLWPRNDAPPASNEYAGYARESAFFSDVALSHVTIEGFIIQHFTYGIQMNSAAASNVVIRNNEIINLRAHNKYAIFLNARDSFVEENRIVNANRAVGILSSADNITVQNNHVERTSRQGIWFMGARNSKILDNTVIDIGGSHSNGISIYSGSTNITVSGNKIIEVNSPVTFEDSSDITFTNNVIAPAGQISDWFGMSGTVAFYNNTFAGSSFYFASNPTYVFKNNILLQAPPKGTRSHNVFTTNQGSLETGEIVETDLNQLFVAPLAYDFRLRIGSRAIDSGTAVPVAADLAGVARPQGSGWDIGAYEFTSNGAGPLPPKNLRVVE
jgi:parallel beta-helix repeat protein